MDFNDPLISLILKTSNKFNQIFILNSDILSSSQLSLIKNNSVNDSDYYFNIIRIYYYNLGKSKSEFEKKILENLDKYKNFFEEKEKTNKENLDKQSKMNKSIINLNKSSDNSENIGNIDNIDNSYDTPDNPTDNIDRNTSCKSTENETTTNEDISNEDISNDSNDSNDSNSKVDPILEEDLKSNDPGLESHESTENLNSRYKYSTDEFKNDNGYLNFINKIKDNYKIYYKSKLFKKLYKYIVLKTHPDKNDCDLLNKIFIISQESYENNDMCLLFIIAYCIGYKFKKLSNEDKNQLDKNISKIILSRKQYVNLI